MWLQSVSGNYLFSPHILSVHSESLFLFMSKGKMGWRINWLISCLLVYPPNAHVIRIGWAEAWCQEVSPGKRVVRSPVIWPLLPHFRQEALDSDWSLRSSLIWDTCILQSPAVIFTTCLWSPEFLPSDRALLSCSLQVVMCKSHYFFLDSWGNLDVLQSNFHINELTLFLKIF